MPAPIRWTSKLLLAKIEATEGTDPTPTGAANAILAKNVRWSPMEGDDVSRDLETPYLSADAMIPANLRGRLQFDVELWPSGTAGVAPGWGPLLRGCGCQETIVADTSVTYEPISDAMESVTFYIWHGLTQQKLSGARGTCVMRWPAGALPMLEFDFLGLYATPTEVSQATPTYSGFLKPLIVNKANTTFSLNSVDLVLREASLDLGGSVEPRMLVGREQILIPERAEAFSARVEAVPVSTLDPFSLAEDQTSFATTLVHGTAAGKIATLSLPTGQMRRPTGMENSQNVLEWPLQLTPLPSSGNDQWSLALT